MHQHLYTLEQSQGRFRLFFVGVFMVYLACAYQFSKTPPWGALNYLSLGLYLAFAGTLLVVSHTASVVSTQRLNVCIVVDQLCMALLYGTFGEVTTPVLLCPALASIGYGVRYGPAYAYKSAFAGLVCLVPAMALSEYWRSVPLTATGLILSNCCLPVYAAAISQQIRSDNWRMRRRASDLLLAKEAVDFQVRRDSLTGLLNRFGLDEVINSIANAQDKLVAVAAMDLDGFKQLNDTFGHQVGDELLVRVSDLIRRHIAGEAARYGGDEFVFALTSPSTHVEILHAFEELRSAIATLKFSPGIHVSASIGIYFIGASATLSKNEILEQADKLMYLAKRNGRNQVQTNDVALVSTDR